MKKRTSKYAPNEDDHKIILSSLRKLIKDKKILRGAAKKVSEELSIDQKVVDFVLKEIKINGEYEGFQKAAPKKKGRDWKFNTLKPAEVIQRLTTVTKNDKRYWDRQFWIIEIAMLWNLCEKYPHHFIEKLELSHRVESLKVLECVYFREYIEKRYIESKFIPKKQYPRVVVCDTRFGEDIVKKKKKSLKSFLNNGKNN